ncbi:zinc finger protein 232 isoform X2 [Dama dama]|uniref:zinc finger protein 232 isoform X2 n=1 Tax=Dama dama TaxID=30532 RepID=UPI002A371998|nr:zinc finger protein 232 isoform X2 [Dama dama]
MAVSLTAAKTLALLGTQDQEKVMMMEPKEEKQTWECETRLHGNHSPSQEIFCQHFRQLCYQEAPGAREALNRLRVLCCERLRSESYSKEQILELLVYLQFPSNIAEDDAETKDKGSLPQPPITEEESQVLREKLATSTTTFEAASEGLELPAKLGPPIKTLPVKRGTKK